MSRAGGDTPAAPGTRTYDVTPTYANSPTRERVAESYDMAGVQLRRPSTVCTVYLHAARLPCADTKPRPNYNYPTIMTDHQPTPNQPWIRLSDRLLQEFRDLRYRSLQFLTNLRAFEHSGRTIQVGTTLPTLDTSEDPTWQEVHRSTLEKLLRAIFQYYRRLHSLNDLQELVQRLLAEDPPPFRNYMPP